MKSKPIKLEKRNNYPVATGRIFPDGSIQVDWIFGKGDIQEEYSNLYEAIIANPDTNFLSINDKKVCKSCGQYQQK